MSKPTFIIADDHPLMQEAIKQLLDPELDIVGTVQDGRSLVTLAAKLLPVGVIIDVSLPELNGFEAARQISEAQPKAKIIFFTMYNQPPYVREGFRAGASAYVSKGSGPTELIKAVRAVLRDQQFVSLPEGGAELMLPNTRAKALLAYRELTARQREVLQLVAEGKSAKIIAVHLNISSKTVEFHKGAMMEKLHVQTTSELVRYAVESGIVGCLGDPNITGQSFLSNPTPAE